MLKNLLKNLGLLLGTTLLCLGVLDVGLRVVYGSPPPFKSPQVRHVPMRPYGYKLQANQQGVFTLDKPVRSNAFGFRGGPWAAPRDTSVPRVMIIGDSFTFGNNSLEENAFPFVLERKLRGALGRAEVLDAGVGGWNSDNEAEFYVAEGRTYDPDVVVIAFYNNDYQAPEDSVITPVLSVDGRLDSRPTWMRWLPFNVLFWIKRSALVVYLRDRIQAVSEPRDSWNHRLSRNEIDLDHDPVVKFTYWELSRIRDSASAHGVPVILAVLPSVNTFWTKRAPVKWVDHLGAFAAREGMTFVDLSAAFWSQTGNRNRFFGYPWDNHFSPSGHQLAAEALYPSIMQALASRRVARSTGVR
jgi:hypothetical protein